MNESTTSCGCAEFNRRRFLGGTAALGGAAAFTAVTGTAFTQAALAASGSSDNVLVVLSLRGGADGLSLVVPHGDAAYELARPTIGVPRETLLGQDEMFGLHPMFEPLMPLWDDDKLAAVHAVGLPAPNRSHFAAMEEVEDADPGSSERRGWLNRLIGVDEVDDAAEAIQIGSQAIPVSLYGLEPVLGVTTIDDMVLPSGDNADARRRRRKSLRTAWRDVDTVAGRGAMSALDLSKVFEDLAEEPGDPLNGAVYPNGDLGRSLATGARLIRADMGVQVLTVDYGDWDMHAGLGTLDGGDMVNNVEELAAAIGAFFTDLGDLDSSVTLVTITEFGRRVAENASRGLDHGYGNAMLLAGAGVRGGKYYGQWPGLGSGNLVDGDLAVTRDYRSVLSEVVTTRFDASVSDIFPGFSPEYIGVMRGA